MLIQFREVDLGVTQDHLFKSAFEQKRFVSVLSPFFCFEGVWLLGCNRKFYCSLLNPMLHLQNFYQVPEIVRRILPMLRTNVR